MIEIIPFMPQMAEQVVSLISADPFEYRRHFTGFSENPISLVEALQKAYKDSYWLIRVSENEAGFFMLRGLDAGYRTPAFGVYIFSRYAGMGLAKVGFSYSMAWCRLNGLEEIMLTVADDNAKAILLYERAGMLFGGERSAKGHRIYRKKLS